MNRVELEHAIAAATEIVAQDQVLVIGSQAILGSFSEDLLPDRATASQEVDIASLADDEAESLATRLDAAAGEWSPFDDENGFYIRGVSVATAYLPVGWAGRLVEVRPASKPGVVGLCLEPHDLCAAKLARNDEKDREFVGALIDAGLVEADIIGERVRGIEDPRFSTTMREIVLGLISTYRRRTR